MNRTLSAAAIAAALLYATPAAAQMKGDAGAIELANQMIENIGGKELWSKIRTLYVVEKSRTPNGDGIMGTFWRDLESPREWYRLETRRGDTIRFWWDERGVYQTINGEVTTGNLPDDIFELVTGYWPGEIYVLYHQIAAENPAYRYEKGEENGQFMVVEDATDKLLATFWVNADGDMYRWKHFDLTDPVEYIYGPHKQFGDISFPMWGTQVNGSWMFEYIEVRWTEEEPPVSYDPPEIE